MLIERLRKENSDLDEYLAKLRMHQGGLVEQSVEGLQLEEKLKRADLIYRLQQENSELYAEITHLETQQQAVKRQKHNLEELVLEF